MEAVNLLHTFNQVIELEAKGVTNVIKKTFIVAFKYSLSLAISHNLDKFSQGFYFL